MRSASLALAILGLAATLISADSAYDFRTILAATPGVPVLLHPEGVALSYGRIYVSDTGRHVIRRIIPRRSTVVYAGQLDSPGSEDGSTLTARFNSPTAIVRAPILRQSDPDVFYVADTGNHTIRKITRGAVTTVAGSPGLAGAADGVGGAALFNAPRGLYVEADGTVYVSDTGNHTVRRIAPNGTVTTIAGAAGVPGARNGPGASALFNMPWGITRAFNDILVVDSGNHAVRAIDPAGNVTTFAGTLGVAGLAEGPRTSARFNRPTGIACCAEAEIFVADTGNHTIRLPLANTLTIVDSNGQAGYEDGAEPAARFNGPVGIAVDPMWALVIADTQNSAIRDGVTPSSGRSAPVILTNPANRAVASNGSADFTCGYYGVPDPAIEWETSGDAGRTWVPLEDNGIYSGTNRPTLSVQLISYPFQGQMYRCVVSSSGGVATSAPAVLTITDYPASVSRLFFQGTRYGNIGPLASLTPAQTVTLRWGGPVQWTVSASQPWITIGGGKGVGDGSFTVAIDPAVVAGMSGSTFTASVAVPIGPEHFPLRIAITLDLVAPTATAEPFGVFETPAAGATGVQGAVAVTGWALDDVAIDRVEIWRDRAAGETTPVFAGAGPGNGKIFVATATFVAGARPDVAAAFPTAPFASRAGWGYMLLTQGLWNQGNGPFTLHAFAFDVEGRAATLGSKTITVDNANATLPFGTIDTPAYGGTVSGVIHNFGWALTPGSGCSVTTVQVSIDSGPLMPVSYGDARSDVAAAFPGHANSAAAGAHFTLDTTTLTNGMHTIGWLVTDSCARVQGVGSRFFTVSNGT